MLRRFVLFVFGSAFLNACVSLFARGGEARSLPREARGRREMISWVVLSNSYVELDVASLRVKLDEVYPGKFLPPGDRDFVIDGPTPGQFFIKSTIPGASGMFLLISVRGSYTGYSDFAEFIGDADLLGKVKAQCCWLSVDLVGPIGAKEDAWPFIEQVLAKLAPRDAAFLVDPQKRITVAFSDDIRDRFAKGERILLNP